MIPHLLYYQLLVLGLLWLFVMLSLAWPSPNGPQEPRPATPVTSRRTRGTEPQPFAGLTHKPPCALCDQQATPPTQRLRCHPPPCRHPLAIPARSTPRGSFVHMPAVAIVAGWGWGTSAPTGTLMA